MRYISFIMVIFLGCGSALKLDEPKAGAESGLSPKTKTEVEFILSAEDEQTILGLETEIAMINLDNFREKICGGDAACIARGSSYFNTTQKRSFLNQKTVQGLLEAAKEGVSVEVLMKAVKDAKKASVFKGISISDYAKMSSPEGLGLLICMADHVPKGKTYSSSGFIYDNRCFFMVYIKTR
jgi:hypothetical protein